MSDLRIGVSPEAQRVLDKAETLQDSLRAGVDVGDELRIEFKSVSALIDAEGLTEAALVRGGALFIVMLERMAARAEAEAHLDGEFADAVARGFPR